MPDAIFADPRLAQIYDWMESERSDLDAYVAMAQEFEARSVLDVGCGTGTLCLLLAAAGLDVVGVDPAEASLDVARSKRGAAKVQWISGDAKQLPPMQVDLAFMTANVAQVFLSDDEWNETLKSIHAVLKPGGRFIFETRNPACQAWLGWNREQTEAVATIPGVGEVTGWCNLSTSTSRLFHFGGLTNLLRATRPSPRSRPCDFVLNSKSSTLSLPTALPSKNPVMCPIAPVLSLCLSLARNGRKKT